VQAAYSIHIGSAIRLLLRWVVKYCKLLVQNSSWWWTITCSKHVKDNLSSFIPLVCAECDDSLPFSGASSIPLCYIPFPSTLFHQLVFHRPSLHLAIRFLVYLSALFLPNSYIIFFCEFYFLKFSVQAQANVIYLTLLSLL
jgi:hypothetical protein